MSIILQQHKDKQKKKKLLKWTKKDIFYERLSKTTKNQFADIAQSMKAADEKRNCTFTPHINEKGSRFNDP